MKERIKQLMEHLNMNQQSFASFIGIGPASLSSILQERTRPTLNTVEAICNKMPDINITWLINGTGDMFLSSASTDEHRNSDMDPVASPTVGSALQQPDLFGAVPVTPSYPNASHDPMVRQAAARAERVVVSEKNIDKDKRRITEIRVFYDDQTWESFVPKK